MAVTTENHKALLYMSDKRIMYIGRQIKVLQQSGAPTSLVFSIDSSIELFDEKNNRCYRSKSFLIPAGARTTIRTHNSAIGFCFLDTLGTDLATLRSSMKKAIFIDEQTCVYSGIPNERWLISKTGKLLKSKAPAEYALGQLSEWIEQVDGHSQAFADLRVTKAIAMIKESALENRAVDSIASDLNLSVPRLSQLFKQVTGVPIRRYRLWHRMFLTASKMAFGMSLTEAAVSSGFSDSAHFSRVFKEIAGVKPSIILSTRNQTIIQLLPPAAQLEATVKKDTFDAEINAQ